MNSSVVFDVVILGLIILAFILGIIDITGGKSHQFSRITKVKILVLFLIQILTAIFDSTVQTVIWSFVLFIEMCSIIGRKNALSETDGIHRFVEVFCNDNPKEIIEKTVYGLEDKELIRSSFMGPFLSLAGNSFDRMKTVGEMKFIMGVVDSFCKYSTVNVNGEIYYIENDNNDNNDELK